MLNIEKYFSQASLKAMDKRYRATFINSLGGFKSVAMVGTQNKNGQTNLAIFSSIVHLGADPALVGLIVRPCSVERHTYENIIETGAYTLNHITSDITMQAHQTSARYERNESEFEKCGLTAEYLNGFEAPYVKESKIKIGLKLRDRKGIELNDTTLMIGEISQIYLPEGIIDPDGFIDLELADTITCSGLDSYHNTKRIARVSYAKPNTWPERMKARSV